MSKIAGVVLGSAALVAGHGYVSGAVVDGQYYGGFLVDKYSYMSDPPKVIGWSEDATDLGFVDGSSYSDADIICHKDAKAAGLSASVKAGGSVELQWTEWPESHHGPVITYLANCNGDCSNVDKTALEFFKIDEAGLINDDNVPGTWATDNLISNNNSYTVTIPSGIESGNYVLRHEIIALHSAGESNGAQNYPQCLNLEVTGGGSDAPSGTVGTELYTNTDPGILVNIYQSMSSYTIPGPALYSGAASPSGSASSSGSANSGSASSTPLATKATATASPSTQAAGGSVAPIATASASPVSASPLRSPSAIPHPSSISRGSRPTFSSRPRHSSIFSASVPKVTVPGAPERPTKPAPSVTVTSQSQATDQVTIIDQPASQTSNAAPGATFTATATGQSAQSSSPAGEDNSAPSAVPSAVPSSTPTTGESGTTSASSGASTGSGSQGDASSYNSSDWSSYLNSMSADQFLSMLRDTMKWLVTDKKHARDLNI